MRSFLPPRAIVMAVSPTSDSSQVQPEFLFIGENLKTPGPASELFLKMIQAMGLSLEKRDQIELCTVSESSEKLTQIKPRVIVSFGEATSQAVLVTQLPLEELRTQDHFRGEARVIPTFDPEFLIQKPEFKKQAWADLQKAIG